jgi:phosphoserine phosphatase
VRRLGVLRAAHPNLPVVAYGNADSDIPHLRLAERGVLVNGNRRARDHAAKTRVYSENWS